MENTREIPHALHEEPHIELISSSFQANQLFDRILSKVPAVIGVDIEAAIEMSRFGVISLIQIAYEDTAYILDLVEMNHKEVHLQKLFEQTELIKVFHDCLEDLSLLCNLCHIKTIKGVFDTQVAHRMCYSFIDEQSHKCKNSAISLANLVQKYLGVEYELKAEMHELMAKNPYLWKGRPLEKKLIQYAGKDVLYLPKIYDIIKANCLNKSCMQTSMPDILNECCKYVNYVTINLKIKNFNRTNLQQKTIVQGFIKNYQRTCVFIQLNIGYMGIVVDEKSISQLKSSFSLGDICLFQITELDIEKKRYVLELSQTCVNAKKVKHSSIERHYQIPKLKVCMQTFIPSHLKNKTDKSQFNSNSNEEEKRTDFSKKLSSYFKDINMNQTSLLIQKDY